MKPRTSSTSTPSNELVWSARSPLTCTQSLFGARQAETVAPCQNGRFPRLLLTGGSALLLLLVAATVAQIPTAATADIRASFRFNGAARQCADLIAPCLALPQPQRPGCLFEVSLDSHCEGSELGGLAFRRWASETGGEGEAELAEPFAASDEPMNRSCVEKFDKVLSERLKSGHLSSSEVYQLSSTLDSCRIKTQNPELLRP